MTGLDPLTTHATHDAISSSFAMVARYGELAIRSLLILSGGAVLAVLAFAGNAASQGPQHAASYLGAYGPALICFGFSSLFAVIAPALAYVSSADIQTAITTVTGCTNEDHVPEANAQAHALQNRATSYRTWAIRSWIAGIGLFAVALGLAAWGTYSIATRTNEAPKEVVGTRGIEPVTPSVSS
jgi:hypothetical protein